MITPEALTRLGGVSAALVIENDPTDDARRLGDWLTEAGLALDVRRVHAGDPLPEELAEHSAVVVLGGSQDAYPEGDTAPWFPQLEALLRKAVRHRVPTLAICLGGQLLAQAHGGTVERSAAGPEIGPGLVARRDAAERDPLWAPVPFVPDVLQYHYDEITELPLGATLLATSSRYPHQAFRLGDLAWGTQFHFECDTDQYASWIAPNRASLVEQGIDPDELIERVDGLMDDLFEVWQPFARRFADLALGRLEPPVSARATLPLLG
ncbi:MAG: type 1 glutamine amidotransferase [Hamadaea sp.]|nr:type 1 glutamine amidotransferase [Hamadaea sp.]NUR50591.1 type 1 glutamine amidotransferase [Hamadaea sp.]NUT02112.1 type 1 glutamine amidotransferase [Hamadaea sp.]